MELLGTATKGVHAYTLFCSPHLNVVVLIQSEAVVDAGRLFGVMTTDEEGLLRNARAYMSVGQVTLVHRLCHGAACGAGRPGRMHACEEWWVYMDPNRLDARATSTSGAPRRAVQHMAARLRQAVVEDGCLGALDDEGAAALDVASTAALCTAVRRRWADPQSVATMDQLAATALGVSDLDTLRSDVDYTSRAPLVGTATILLLRSLGERVNGCHHAPHVYLARRFLRRGKRCAGMTRRLEEGNVMVASCSTLADAPAPKRAKAASSVNASP